MKFQSKSLSRARRRHFAAPLLRSFVLKVGDVRIADLLRKREQGRLPILAADLDAPFAPYDIGKFKHHDSTNE
jgi:hypothetical protein